MKLIDNDYLFNLEERQTKKIWKRGLGWPILKHPSNLQESIKPCLFRQKVKSATMEKCAKKKFSLSPPSRRKRRGENARERSKESLQLDCRTLLPSSGTFLFDGDEQSRKSAHAFGRPDNILNDHRMMNFFFEIYFLKKWAILGNFFV